jgi:hypothetical protein
VAAFGRGLWGWEEGKNVRIDYRFAAGDAVLFKKYAAELVGLSPDVILAGMRFSSPAGPRRAARSRLSRVVTAICAMSRV